ncbi:MAG: hypothetical protein HETSPECPRED_004512 [Heterodermia speciosa]|uniref:DNA repair metallo-beta-lactamase domain-containing protein n=1 Tax=Heterodermia speciosa TaxID=116794 RepID=A0A8H3FES4_9LECA|nr:MAG: hypothetical protein HETSPECPRED_004512 [Heterodermia speciosa]
MFRKPREVITSLADVAPQAPSTGRPPTPPQSSHRRPIGTGSHKRITMTAPSTPLVGRNRTAPKVTRTSFAGKAKSSMNGNILNFFQKAGPTAANKKSEAVIRGEESLFLDDDDFGTGPKLGKAVQTPTPPKEYDEYVDLPDVYGWEVEEAETMRYNEDDVPVKRRKTEHMSRPSTPSPNMDAGARTKPFFSSMGTFDDQDMEGPATSGIEAEPCNNSSNVTPGADLALKDETTNGTKTDFHPIPSLKQECTSYAEVNDFEGLEDFIDDEFPEEGEEYIERRWMQEQAELEMGLEEDDEGTPSDGKAIKEDAEVETQIVMHNEETTSCPICSASLAGISDQQVSLHVNGCLDGKPIPLPNPTLSVKVEPKPAESKEKIAPYKRFQRAAIARPGQENPFSLTSTPGTSSSAFSTLMSGHAEDAAWANAAAAETASRGKPAYQRTCPFYKILPGFSICVDAFRYGAVEGCKAYFLSHFHSDHYIGLSSSWCHGPIYCSHVTANLVRQQLRVDPKWVFDLDFDRKMEVPNTDGVEVTMIPANHCPGSSLYLYEKVVGKGKNPKVQRVLHCGDFRACPAHVQHPLLRPDVVDAVSGKNIAQQKLDVCYLDTTYLTPKYAFPSQEEVIQACADMCVSLSKDFIDQDDSWEQTKRERAGSGMVKFVRKDSAIKEDDDTTSDAEAVKDKKARGRLLVIVGTYSIGKERICLGVARALNSKIYAPPNKQKICAALEDPELSARLTNDPLEAQVHMQMLMEIRAETLADYLTGYKPHFSRIVGFRPSGWNYRPPNSRFTESPAVQTVLHSDNWKSKYSMAELVPQRGSTREANCFGVPYSEHSSFRELTMFCCALRIDKIIPTVNVGSAKSREKMKGWSEKWAMDKKKNGLFKVENGQRSW